MDELLLRKGVYTYEYMDDWEKFEENHIPPNLSILQRTHSVRNWQVRLPPLSESLERVWDEGSGGLS